MDNSQRAEVTICTTYMTSKASWKTSASRQYVQPCTQETPGAQHWHIPSMLVNRSSDGSGTARALSLLRLSSVCTTHNSQYSCHNEWQQQQQGCCASQDQVLKVQCTLISRHQRLRLHSRCYTKTV